MPPREEPSARQLARRDRRQAGERSARLARELMKLDESRIAKLELEPSLHAAVTRARAVTSMSARRRAERTLASELRGVELSDLQRRLANVHATGSVDAGRLHAAERWRSRLVDEGSAAIAEFPGGADDHALLGLIAQARRERTTGKPVGAARALFRHIVEALAPPHASETGDGRDDDDDDAGA